MTDFTTRGLWSTGEAVLVGVAALTVCSQAAIPMTPVPITLQTLAVTLVGALYGWRLGGLAVLAWLGVGALGLPVLADGARGLDHFAGPTAGYLFAFPLAAMLTGRLAERGWNGARPLHALAAMTLGNGFCLMLGAGWLALAIGPTQALAVGVAPFLPGALIKSGAGAAVLAAVQRAGPR
ncbi:MAG: biotin transport system substrate-specific component [Brevundimonas sp.]|uniref:biotin transporter BioY n=1 Tax=Brevundimonas sp. TaxID=1871086 RepID=UPI0039E4BB13